jgi:hypothetical protein
MAQQPSTTHTPARDQPKPDETRRDWEDVQTNANDKTERLKVVGGWLYRSGTSGGTAVGLCFVPDARA